MTPKIAQTGLVVLAIVTVAGLLIAAGSAMAPFAVGLVLAYLLSPVVNALSKWMRRPLAILLVYLLGGLMLTGFLIFVVPPLLSQAQRLIQSLPNVATLQAWARQGIERYQEITPDALEPQIAEAVQSAIPSIQSGATTLLRNTLTFVLGQVRQVFGLIGFLVGFLIVPIWLFYVLNDQRQGMAAFNRMLSYRFRADFWNAWGIIDRSLSAYIRGQLTLGLIIGVAVGVGLGVLDLIPGVEIDFILLLAIWAGITELIPMIGAILGALPGVILAFVLGGPVSGIVVLVMYTIIQQVENNFLVPRVIGESVGVHPAVLTVLLIAMGSVFGLVGVIVAAPLAAIARDLYLYAYRRLGGDSPDAAIERISHRVHARATQKAEAPV
jgi:predicted PurR-regulated permease PerM